MKRGFIAGAAAVTMTVAPPVHAGADGSAALFLSPSLAVKASIGIFKLASVITASVVEVMDDDEERADRTGFRQVESVAERGSDFFMTSFRFAGDVAMVSFRASVAGEGAAPGAADEVAEFTFEMDRAALEDSLAESQTAPVAIAEGTEVPVAPVAITAGSAERLIGYSVVLASEPDVVVCVVLNDVGRQLYAAQT